MGYAIVKFWKDDTKGPQVIVKGLTEKKAKEICRSPDTETSQWFYGYDKDKNVERYEQQEKP